MLKRALIHPPASYAAEGGGITAHTHIWFFHKSTTLWSVRCNKGISLWMEISMFCIRPFFWKYLFARRVSSAWTPLCSCLRRCNFSPRSGWVLGCWSIVSWKSSEHTWSWSKAWMKGLNKGVFPLDHWTGDGFIRSSCEIGRLFYSLQNV